MVASPDLVARGGDLKRDLVEFAHSRRFVRRLEQAIERAFDDAGQEDESTAINAIDHFMLQSRQPDGRTLVEIFIEHHPELSADDREMLLRWRDVVEGIFEVARREGDTLVLTNLVDEMTYRVHSNIGPEVFGRMPRGSFVLTRVVPIADEWMFSGAMSLYPKQYRDEIYRAATDLSVRRPASVFRNPEKLEQGWALQRKERGHFLDFFGTDLVVLSGREAGAGCERTHTTVSTMCVARNGKSAADQAREKYGAEPPELNFGLPPDLSEAESVAVVYDEVEGMLLWRDFAQLEETFADPDLALRPPYRQLILTYLKDESISPVAIRRLAERDPGRASRIFARVLKRPAFSWARDGDALLRHEKASYFEHPPIPSIIPISQALGQASRRPSAASAAESSGQPTRRRTLPSNRSAKRRRRRS